MVMPTGPTGPPSLPPTPPQVHKDPTLPHHNTVQRCTIITDLTLISHTSTQIHHAPKTLTHTSNDTYKRNTPKFSIFTFFSTQKVRHPKTTPKHIHNMYNTTMYKFPQLSDLSRLSNKYNTLPPPHFSVWGGGQGKRETVRQIHTDSATVQKIETWK